MLRSQAGSLHIVTELASRGDLSQLIARYADAANWIPEADIWDMFIQTCQGLTHLHTSKILHRDLKPQNIFLAEHGAIKIGKEYIGFVSMRNKFSALTYFDICNYSLTTIL